MSTSGTYLFDPDLAEIVEEAFERIGMDPAAVSYRHIVSARRSMNYLFSRWATRGVHQWATEHTQHTVTVGERQFTLPAGAIDVLTMVLRRDDADTPLYPIARQEYEDLNYKDFKGRPDRYFVDKRADAVDVYYWQAASNDTDIIDYWYCRQIQDAGRAHNTLDMPFYFKEAFVAGLAARLAEKYSPERWSAKEQLYARTFEEALRADGSRAPLTVAVKYP